VYAINLVDLRELYDPISAILFDRFVNKNSPVVMTGDNVDEMAVIVNGTDDEDRIIAFIAFLDGKPIRKKLGRRFRSYKMTSKGKWRRLNSDEIERMWKKVAEKKGLSNERTGTE